MILCDGWNDDDDNNASYLGIREQAIVVCFEYNIFLHVEINRSTIIAQPSR
jgi:hypothetical protein